MAGIYTDCSTREIIKRQVVRRSDTVSEQLNVRFSGLQTTLKALQRHLSNRQFTSSLQTDTPVSGNANKAVADRRLRPPPVLPPWMLL